jgi:hypothetical protein
MVAGNTSRRTRRLAVVLASASVLVAGASLPVAYATGDDRRLETRLTGAAEIPGPGDPDGRGKAQIRLKKDEVCFELSWRNIEPPNMAHIHVGPPDAAGPVVVLFFDLKDTTLGPSVSSIGGCTTAEPDLIAAIRDNPGDYYVNIHNVPFPAGAIRGQLHR